MARLRSIWGGRASVRAALYMSALVAMIRDFYQRLLARGKPKKSALTAHAHCWSSSAILKTNTPWHAAPLDHQDSCSVTP